MLTAGDLTVTAVFDKPGMPGRPHVRGNPAGQPLPAGRSRSLAAAVRTAADAARSLGLSTGPVHAELRIADRGGRRPAMLELAPRSIGGLCSRALRFPGGASLEEIVLANALGRPVPPRPCPARPSRRVHAPGAAPGRPARGRGPGRAPWPCPAITGLTITIPPGQRVRPLPDGDRYLGFIFAEADTPHGRRARAHRRPCAAARDHQ